MNLRLSHPTVREGWIHRCTDNTPSILLYKKVPQRMQASIKLARRKGRHLRSSYLVTLYMLVLLLSRSPNRITDYILWKVI